MARTNGRLYDRGSPCGNSCATVRPDPEWMHRTFVRRTATGDVVCESSGRLPQPRRRRLRLARLAVLFPIELLLLVLVMGEGLPLLAAAAVLAITTVILSILLVEPLSLRPLGRWQHDSEPPTHRRLSNSAALWPRQVAVEDWAEALGASVSDSPRERLPEIPDVAQFGNRPGLSEGAFRPGTGPRSSWH
jgi:hypothetical protein